MKQTVSGPFSSDVNEPGDAEMTDANAKSSIKPCGLETHNCWLTNKYLFFMEMSAIA